MGLCGTSALAIALLATSALGTSATTAAVANCKVATNIAIILDDSGSMDATDFGKLRVAGIKLLLNKSANAKKTMSALQFGSDASSVFGPGIVGPNVAPFSAALDANINADNGTTNYNAAFELRKTQNPNADRIIFLTDGGHNEGDYANGHAGGPPVDVVGFSSSTAGADGARLQAIANETHGTYHSETDASNLQAIMNEIDATENCQNVPTKYQDQFTDLNRTISHSLSVPRSTKAIDVTLSWGSANDGFDVSKLVIVNHGQTVARIARKKRKVRKLRVRRSSSGTFTTLHVTRIKRGRLKFKLKALKLGAPGVPVTLTTQVTQGR